jgi:hypothetical protein
MLGIYVYTIRQLVSAVPYIYKIVRYENCSYTLQYRAAALQLYKTQEYKTAAPTFSLQL